MAVLAGSARRRCERRLSRHPSAGRRAHGAITNAPPVYSKDETPAAFLAGEFIRWLVEQDATRLVRAYLVHLAASALRRAGTLQHHVRSGRRPGLPPRSDEEGRTRKSIPTSTTSSRNQRIDNFVVGAKGKVADRSEAEFRQIRATYYGMISEVDAQLGRVWAAVKKHGDWDDTIVILTSDHAEMMGDHLHARQRRLLRRQLPHPADRPRPAADAGGRPQGRGVHRSRRHPADRRSTWSAAKCRPISTDARWCRFSTAQTPPAGATPRIGSSISARSPKRKAETHFGIDSRQCNLAVVRTETFKYVHFGGGLPPVLFDLVERSGRDAERRRRSGLSLGPARHGRAAAWPGVPSISTSRWR